MKSLSLSTPHVVFIIGTPGAGKTYFASKFADMFSAPFVESDKLRAAISTPPTYSPEEQHIVEYLSWLQISELLKTKKTFIVEIFTPFDFTHYFYFVGLAKMTFV